MKNKYRIVERGTNFYVHIKRWYFPFWVRIKKNYHYEFESAIRFAIAHAQPECENVTMLGVYPFNIPQPENRPALGAWRVVGEVGGGGFNNPDGN